MTKAQAIQERVNELIVESISKDTKGAMDRAVDEAMQLIKAEDQTGKHRRELVRILKKWIAEWETETPGMMWPEQEIVRRLEDMTA